MRMLKFMYKGLILLFLVMSAIRLTAQDKQVIYIENETRQPFYVQMNGQVYSSTTSGYIILAQLVKGRYNFVIGFPHDLYPEQAFTVKIDNYDKELTLKKINEKSFALVDMIDSVMLMAGNLQDTEILVQVKPVAPAIKKDSIVAFTEPVVVKDTALVINTGVQSAAAKDSSVAAAIVNQTALIIKDSTAVTPVVVNQNQTAEVVKDTLTPVNPLFVTEVPAQKINTDTVKKESPVENVKPVVAETAEINVPVQNNPPAKNTTVSKAFEKVSNTGTDLIYVDKSGSKFDTVAIYIPTNTKAAVKPMVKSAAPAVVVPVQSNINPIKTNAVTLKPAATNDDFLKTRLDMAAATNEEDMLKAAKISFKTKSYTTEQVKNLGFLFLTEKGKLRFFEMAKPVISDISQFSTLGNQFTQPELIAKFSSLNQKD